MPSTLILNPGSSSVKFRVYENEDVVLDGVVDAIGTKSVVKTRESLKEIMNKKNEKIKSFNDAANTIYSLIHTLNINKVAYRVVSGGDKHQIITKSSLQNLKKISKYDPQHMPQTIMLINFFMKHIKGKHIACFDSAFHNTLPTVSKTYAIPTEISKKYNIYRKGFHGLSIENMLEQTTAYFGKKFNNIIAVHLGNGISLTAIKDGKSIDTSMGFTPLEGVVMGHRSGSIDQAIIFYLLDKGHSKQEVLNILENKSGMKGICGDSDIRPIMERVKKGDKKAKLALDLFIHSFKKQLGAYIAELNGVDVIVVGGGMINSIPLRKLLFLDLEMLGIVHDETKLIHNAPVCVSEGNIKVLLVNSDEQETMLKISKVI
ncbi:acetate kinase [Candidatus Woesearchaeota archaeon]|nr:acetate kinase [Candidatus Woesearchaeota archaeon]